MGLTGYKIYRTLRKVSNDGSNTPLDINNIPIATSGEVQDTKSNVVGDIDYVSPISDPSFCPISGVGSSCHSFTIYNTGGVNLNYSYRICGGGYSYGIVEAGLNVVICAEYSEGVSIDSGVGYALEGGVCS